MKVRSERIKFVIGYVIAMTLVNLIMLIWRSDNIIYPIIQEIVVIALAAIFILIIKYKKIEVAYESTGEGINIRGAKEGMYDPDFLKYEEIENLEIEKNRIVINTKDGRIIVLLNLGKSIEDVGRDIKSNIEI